MQLYQEYDPVTSLNKPSKFLTLRVHHLSYYIIYLHFLNGNPFNITIDFMMDNFVDTPNTKEAGKMIHDSKLSISKINNNGVYSIDARKINILRYNSKTDVSDMTNLNISMSTFESIFKTLEENIDLVLATDKEMKKYKKFKKANKKVIDKYVYRSQIKSYEKIKSEARKEIRKTLVKLYSSS